MRRELHQRTPLAALREVYRAGAMRVSVAASALRSAGYSSLLAGLDDLSMRRVELSVLASGETVGLQPDGWPLVAVVEEGVARAYRAGLYDHAVVVTALSLDGPAEDVPDELAVGGVLSALPAAEVLGASVVRVEADEGGRLLGRRRELAAHTAGLRVAVALPPPALGGDDAGALLEWEEDGLGLALDIEALFRAGDPGVAWQALRQAAPHTRCVVCGVGRRDAGGEGTPLAAGGIDYARVAAILGAEGYTGEFTISLTGGEAGGRTVLREDIAYLKDVLGEW
ncbi:MAG: hypothetical protein FJX74_13890 [Armatimonadetes bacterium]|nr:hypothetical protein [Armatimonadota bacterium]